MRYIVEFWANSGHQSLYPLGPSSIDNSSNKDKAYHFTKEEVEKYIKEFWGDMSSFENLHHAIIPVVESSDLQHMPMPRRIR